MCHLSSASRDLRVAVPPNDVYSSVRLDRWHFPGFASQTTVDETGPSSTFPHTTSFSWSSRLRTGITTLKNTVPSAGTNDPVSVSWGYIINLLATTQTEHRRVSTDLQRVMVPVKDLLATFNGRLSNKWEHLDVAGIKRISIMIGVSY